VPSFPPHWRLTFGGSLFGVEQWQMGLNMADIGRAAGPIVNTDSITDTLFPDLVADVRKFVTTCEALSQQTTLDWVKFNHIGTDGRYTSNRTRVAGVTGAQGPHATYLPPQVCIVATLTTDAARGLASKGRIYVPALSTAPVGSTGLIPQPNVDFVGKSVAQLITDLNNQPGIDADALFRVVVVSDGGKHGTPTLRPVTGVRVGHVYDTHQSRRRRFSEAPSAYPLP
jgi:hypothetical protein